MLSALEPHIAVLDQHGNIKYVNQAWARFGEKNGALASRTGVGVNYFEVCRPEETTEKVAQIVSGIQTVIDGSAPRFHAEYACPTPAGVLWFGLDVSPLPKPERGVVVCHTDITQLKRTRDEYAVVLESARAILWRATLPDFQTTFTSKHVESILGFPLEAWLNNPRLWIERIHPEDRDWALALTSKATEEQRDHEFEYRMIAADGHIVWLRNIVRVIVEHGKVTQLIGIAVDRSEQKQAEELASSIRNRLVQAQERERTRIARELHDDIGQRLSLLSVHLDQIVETRDRLPAQIRKALMSAREGAMELCTDVDRLSHELHSSKLEYLGLVKAIEGFCREFGATHAMKVDFRKEELPSSPAPEVSLCLFRILQEGLNNAAKYSGVKTVQVELAPRFGQLFLKISDSGRGFILDEVLEGAGLGITSMQERVRLVNGRISIKSKPMSGTTIEILVPLDGKSQPEAA